MTDTPRPFPFRIFPALMLFCLFAWVWTVAIIMAWPWDKTNEWRADARLPVLCANGETCAVGYGKLTEGLADGTVGALLPKEPVGELQQPDAWLRWKRVDGQPWQIEASLSSWHFETSLRYRVDDGRPVLVQYRHYDAGVFFYALPAALFTLIGVYLRRLRR